MHTQAYVKGTRHRIKANVSKVPGEGRGKPLTWQQVSGSPVASPEVAGQANVRLVDLLSWAAWAPLLVAGREGVVLVVDGGHGRTANHVDPRTIIAGTLPGAWEEVGVASCLGLPPLPSLSPVRLRVFSWILESTAWWNRSASLSSAKFSPTVNFCGGRGPLTVQMSLSEYMLMPKALTPAPCPETDHKQLGRQPRCAGKHTLPHVQANMVVPASAYCHHTLPYMPSSTTPISRTSAGKEWK